MSKSKRSKYIEKPQRIQIVNEYAGAICFRFLYGYSLFPISQQSEDYLINLLRGVVRWEETAVSCAPVRLAFWRFLFLGKHMTDCFDGQLAVLLHLFEPDSL